MEVLEVVESDGGNIGSFNDEVLVLFKQDIQIGFYDLNPSWDQV